MEPHTIQFVGAPCGHHGPYTFYKAFKFGFKGKYRIISLGEFFFVKISEDAPVCIGELQLLWEDKNNESVHMSSLRLYFLPEHTPEGRQEYHGQDEILAENDKIVMRVEDLGQWIIDDIEWPIGSKAVCDSDIKADKEHEDLIKLFNTNNYGLQFKDIKKEKQLLEGDTIRRGSVTILSYSRYCRYRAIMKRLEDVSNSWLKNALVSAIGGFTSPTPGTRVVFCRDTFEHPELATHDYRQDHLAPNLKGRPRKKRLKMRRDMESDSNDSDFTPGREEKALKVKEDDKTKVRRKVLRPNKDKVSAEEESFLSNLIRFMRERKTPIDRIPSLGFKQIDLYYFYSYAQKLGGYEQITQRRMWKHLYDKLGGNPGSTSAATCTRRHYERLLLAFERFQKGEKDTGPLQLPDDYDERCENKSDDPDIITIPDNDDDDEIPQKNNVFKGLPNEDSMMYKNDIARVNHNNASIQKNVLSEHSSNHFTQKPQELGARRVEAKENGSAGHNSIEVHHNNRPMQNVAVMQREPNVVMVVSKNGDIVRNSRGAPSIMTPLKKPNTPHMLTPQGVPVAFVHQPQHHAHHHHHHHHHAHHHHHKLPNQTAAHTPSQHRSQFPNQASAHQHKQYTTQFQSRPAHQNLTTLQQRPSGHHSSQHQHPHPPHHHHQQQQHHPAATKASTSGVPNNNRPVHVIGVSPQAQRTGPRATHALPTSSLVAHDPRRPTVIQHTQIKQEIRTPPPAHHHKGFGHHVRQGGHAQPSPPPAGIKRPYPFPGGSNLPQALTSPPTAHNFKPIGYTRDIGPFANSVKRPHLQNSHDPAFTPSASTTAGPHRINKLQPASITHKPTDDMPTDLSMKRVSSNASTSALNFSTNQSPSQGLPSRDADEGPLNLVTHRRAPEITPSPVPLGVKLEDNRLVLPSHSPNALTFDNHSKVPKDMSASSSNSRVSPRTLAPDNTLISSRPLSRASPQVSPRPASLPSPNFPSRVAPGTQQRRAQSPGERFWSSPQGATPTTASPDAGAASIHPAFPSTSLHIMPGLLPPPIRPHVFYEAQLRATQSPRQATDGATPQGTLAPPKQTLTEQRK